MDKRHQIRIFSAAAVVMAGAGLFFLTRIDEQDILSPQSVLCVFGAVLLFFYYEKRMSSEGFFTNRRKIVFSAFFSLLFSMSLFIGYQLRVFGVTSPGVKGKLGIFLYSFFLSFLFFPFFEHLFSYADRRSGTIRGQAEGKWNPGKAFFLSWGMIFICWMPVFLAYYPGIMSYDSNRQFTEAYLGVFWNLQPVIHTFLIRLALLLGERIGSYEMGVAAYTIIQMLVLSLSFAYSVSFAYELTKRRRIVILTSLFLGICPVFSVLALCVTKDIFFTAFFLCFCTMALKRFLRKPKRPLVYDLGMLLCGVIMFQFRKNAIYGFALFALFYILAMKKERIRIAALCLVILLCGWGGGRLLLVALNGTPGPKTEVFSVPIQQMGHVAFFQRENLTEEETELLEKYIPGCTTNEGFNISLADGLKYNASAKAWTDTPQMLKDWLSFGVKYPNDYLDAHLGLTAGYYFVDDIAISRYLGYGRENMRGLIETFNASKPIEDYYAGVESRSVLPKLRYFLEGIVSDEQYLNWPVLSALFRPACYCWAMAAGYGLLLYKKRYRSLAAASFQLTYFCTILLGPVASIRYVFQIMAYIIPFWIFVLFSLKENGSVPSDLPSAGKEEGTGQEG